MNTLTLLTGQASPVTYVPAGSRITMSGSGSIEWTPGTLNEADQNPSWKTWALGSTAGYKDTLRPLCIRVTATGSCTVTVSEGEADKYGEDAYWEEDAPYFTTDASGNVTGLMGPDGVAIQLPRDLPGLTCCLLGDSFTMRNNPISGVDYALMDWGYFTWANLMLGSPFRLLNNGGVSGETSAEILARVDDDVIAYAPDWCFLLASVNDNAGGLTPAETVANQQAAIAKMRAAGINVVVLAICPYTANADATKNMHRVNRAMAEFCAETPGTIFVDTYAAMVNPTSATGALASGMSDDALHPSVKGARAMGTAIYNAISPFVKNTLLLPSSASESYSVSKEEYQLLTNPLFTGSAGAVSGVGVSGTVATDWTVGLVSGSLTAVASVPARADGFGNDQKIVITGASSGASINCRLTSNHSAKVSTGDTVYFVGELTLENPVDVAYVRAAAYLNVGGVTYVVRVLENSDSTYDQTAFTLKFRTPEFVVPAGAITVCQCRADIGFGTSGAGSADLSLGRAGLYRIPA